MRLGQITELEYNAIPAVRNSELSNIEKSWAHYKMGNSRTAAMIFGTAFHMYVLEEHTFWQNFTVAPAYDGRTAEGKAIKRQLEEQTAAGKDILRADDFEAIQGMRDALMRHPLAMHILHRSENEGAYTATIEGVECKCKLDLENQGEFFDLKSTDDASPFEFRKSIGKYNYHRQAAFYGDVAAANGVPFNSFNLVAVEKKPPYLVCVHTLGTASIDIGRASYKKVLKKFKFHTENSEAYDGYCVDEKTGKVAFNPIEAPDWVFYQAQNDLIVS